MTQDIPAAAEHMLAYMILMISVRVMQAACTRMDPAIIVQAESATQVNYQLVHLNFLLYTILLGSVFQFLSSY